MVGGDVEEMFRFFEDVVFGEIEGVEMREPRDAGVEEIAAQIKVYSPGPVGKPNTSKVNRGVEQRCVLEVRGYK